MVDGHEFLRARYCQGRSIGVRKGEVSILRVLNLVHSAGAIDAVLTVITKSLKKKEKVLLVGFGTFQVSRRKAGEGRNPQTGEKIKIPASNVPRFKPSKQLKDAIN